MAVKTVIGIDLGTTNSRAAVFWENRMPIIPNEWGNRATPSCVTFTEEERMIGQAAKNFAGVNPENIISEVKRFIGRPFKCPTVQDDIKMVSYAVIDNNNKPLIKVTYKNQVKKFAPEEISAMILAKMKDISEAFLDEEITDVVIAVPAYFNNAQRQATKDAGKIAGLNVLRLINEPTAAALAYGLDKKSTQEQNILVYDLGGETFDVSILTLKKGHFEVKATKGDTHLGGSDFDSLLTHHLVEEIKLKHGKDVHSNAQALKLILDQAEKAKHILSSATQAHVTIPGILDDGKTFISKVSRATFEKICYQKFNETLTYVQEALDDAGMDRSQIDEIILVGGSSRIPKLQHLLQEFFDGKPLNKTVHPDEAVVYGAAMQAAILGNVESSKIESIVLRNVRPHSLKRKTKMPLEKLSIGIHLGTTNSCVAVFKDGDSLAVRDEEGNTTTPFYVAFAKNGRLIGKSAKIEALFPTGDVVYDIKRLIGRKYSDAQADIQHLPFKVLSENENIRIQIQNETHEDLCSPEEISAMILSKMKLIACEECGISNYETLEAVLTVPAYFNDAQRQAMKDAGEIAGLKVLRIIDEPTAAALAYRLDDSSSYRRTVLVFHFGGGTLDVTILKIKKNIILVKSTAGYTNLGGVDLDICLREHFLAQHKELTKSPEKIAFRLQESCQTLKHSLSVNTEENFSFLLSEEKKIQMTLTRAEFEKICKKVFDRILLPVEKALADAKLDKGQIDDIVLVGGSSQIPKVRRVLRDFFNGKKLYCDINGDEAIARGAAIQAALIHQKFFDGKPQNTKTVQPDRVVNFGNVYEGERIRVKDNNLLSTLNQVETHLPLTEDGNLMQTPNQTTEWLAEHPNATKEECQSKKDTLTSMTKPNSQILNKTRQISNLNMESLALTEIAAGVSEETTINSPKTPLSADSFELYLAELRQFNPNAHPLTIKYLSHNSATTFDKFSLIQSSATKSSSPNTLEVQENLQNPAESFNNLDSIDLEYSLNTPKQNYPQSSITLPQSSITSQSIPSFDSLFSQSSLLAAYERRVLKKLRRLKISQILQKNPRITKNRFIYNFEAANLQNVILNAHSTVQMGNIKQESTEFPSFTEFISLIPILLGLLLAGRVIVKRYQ